MQKQEHFHKVSSVIRYAWSILLLVCLLGGFALLSPLAHADTIFSDDFTDTNGTLLETHNSQWQELYGEMVIQNNHITSAPAARYELPGFVLTDQCVSMDVLFPIVNQVYLILRQDNNNDFYYSYLNPDQSNATAIFINMVQPENLGQGGSFGNNSLTGFHTFKLCAIGSDITSYLDNTILGHATDSRLAQGYPGFSIGDGGGFVGDNFLLEGGNGNSISGTVYNDDNQNGTQDAGEGGYSEATVTLNTGQTAITDANGNYTFSNLQAGTYTETVTVPDGYSATTTNPANISLQANTIQNFGIYSAPVVSAITAPASPALVNTSVSTSATFTDGDSTDTHTASWNWGDGNTSAGNLTEPSGSTPGSVTGSHIYASSGVYTVILTVRDNDGASGTSVYQYISIYDPTAQGLFSAGQHFNSPAGAYPSTPGLTGTVKFGLSYKYQGTVPVGDREFTMNFSAASLLFNATSVTSLVLSNGFAILTGTGTMNGGSHIYNFLVTGVNGGGIRIQITDPSNNNNVIYDTQPGAAANAPPTTSVVGNVVVHN